MKYSHFICCIFLLAGLGLSACASDEDRTVRIERITPTGNSTSAAQPAATPTLPLLPTTGPNPATKIASGDLLTVEVDLTQTGNPISPYIYGLAGTDDKDPTYGANLQPGLLRWGGNPSTRFNWVLGNAWNAGRDWEFRNGNYGNPGGDVVTEAVGEAQKLRAAMLLTIPTIGWVAKDSNNNTASLNVPAHGGPPLVPGLAAIAGYDPAVNQALTSVKSVARKQAPFVTRPNPQSTVVYQDEWVASLLRRFGPASTGGVRFYAMDNEPDLWSEAHTDVHPARMGYDDMVSRYIEYASAVKDVDPSAEITGPVVWGWNSYFWSELDRGSDNFKTAADRAKHGNVPFLPWFLDQLRQYEQKNGKRILDVLDIHYYPQATGVYNGTTDPKTNELRLRSTRSLWSDSYIDESWIGIPVRLIPRMREWINQYYPGTKLGISEWNFGADTTLNGALAISQVLGIYGSEGVYLASYWRYPPAGSPGFYAFKMYTNFDDKGSRFGDKSLPVKLSDDWKISAFAARDSQSGRLRLILINPQADRSQNIQLNLTMPLPKQSANVYQLSTQTGNKLAAQNPLEVPGGPTLALSLPAYSATLLDLALPL